MRGAVVTAAGYGTGQLIRLARSLILTRLLFPEAFGLMTLVWALLYGLAMFSDTGAAATIVRDKRGDDPEFLNTAWTVQVLRGAVLWIAACLAAYPVATLYEQPQLAQLIPVATLTALLDGFRSTAIYTAQRHLQLDRVVWLDVGNQVLGLIVTVAWALIDPSVWALVGGALAGHCFHVAGSHLFLAGPRNRFRWERESLKTLIGFGKWIYFSSVFHFLAVQGDRLMLGRFLELAQLGVYSIAVMLVEAVLSLASRVINQVLFSAYGKVAQDEADRLRRVFHRARLAIDAFLIAPIGALMVLGNWIVSVLYDARYHEAGWMFQILCIRLLMVPTVANSESLLVAMGHPQYGFGRSVCRAVWIVSAIPVGWVLGGVEGVVWAVALSELPALALVWPGLARHKMLSLATELRSVLAAALGASIGFALLRLVT